MLIIVRVCQLFKMIKLRSLFTLFLIGFFFFTLAANLQARNPLVCSQGNLSGSLTSNCSYFKCADLCFGNSCACVGRYCSKYSNGASKCELLTDGTCDQKMCDQYITNGQDQNFCSNCYFPECSLSCQKLGYSGGFNNTVQPRIGCSYNTTLCLSGYYNLGQGYDPLPYYNCYCFRQNWCGLSPSECTNRCSLSGCRSEDIPYPAIKKLPKNGPSLFPTQFISRLDNQKTSIKSYILKRK